MMQPLWKILWHFLKKKLKIEYHRIELLIQEFYLWVYTPKEVK